MDTKKKVQKIRQHRNRTGGGSPSNVVLSELDERIVSIVGDFCADGDSSLTEIGFDDSMDGKLKKIAFAVNLSEYNVCIFFKGENQQKQSEESSMVGYSTSSQSINIAANRLKTAEPVGVRINSVMKRAHSTSTNLSTQTIVNRSNAGNLQPNNTMQQNTVLRNSSNQVYVLKQTQNSLKSTLQVSL